MKIASKVTLSPSERVRREVVCAILKFREQGQGGEVGSVHKPQLFEGKGWAKANSNFFFPAKRVIDEARAGHQ